MESACAAAVEALPLRDPSGHVWQPMKDPKTGRVYWTNHALQKTAWKPPQGCTAEKELSGSPGAPTGWGQYAGLGHHHEHSHPGHAAWHAWHPGANDTQCTGMEGMPSMQNMQHRYPGMGMPSMQNMQNMQNRYPGEGEREGERERERDQTRESRTVRGGDAGGYRRDNQGQKVNGPSRRNVEINKQITVCQDSRDLCALIDAHAAEFNNVNVVSAFRKLLQSRREGLHSGVVERALQVLEAAALRMIGAFDAQNMANILHIIAKTRYSPRDQSLVPQLEGRAEAVMGTFNAQEVANTLWAYETMGREPGAGVMRAQTGGMRMRKTSPRQR